MTLRKPTVAFKLVKLAHELYDVIVDETGTPYAVPKKGPQIVAPLTGRGGSLAKRLTAEYFSRYENAPNQNALTSTMQVLEATAVANGRVRVDLRCARTDTGLAIDTGDSAGRVLVVDPTGWRVRAKPPAGVLFRRTRLTAAMPTPSRRGDLGLLRELLNVTDEGWDLVRAWLVMAWLPDVPVPILSATGVQGVGKSFLGRTIVTVVDPSAAPLRSAPKELSDWQTTAAASRVVGIDNISRISEWWSDAMCRAVTGEGSAKRQLYTDDDLHISSFHRAVLLTSIDPGALRGDLAERLLPIELRGGLRRRRSEEWLNAELDRRLPRILGGLLDLVSAVLANPVEPKHLPRMADAAKVMASVDEVLGSHSLDAYRRSQSTMVQVVLEGDPVGGALLQWLPTVGGEWIGTPTELYGALVPWQPPGGRQWPGSPRGLSARLKRLQPQLRDAYGLRITFGRGTAREIRLVWKDAPKPHPSIKSHAR